MALSLSTSFTQDIDDMTAGVVEDTTPDYGTGGNEARNEAANYLLWSKTDKEGNRTYHNPSQGNVLTSMSWNVETQVSGWYERILLRIPIYDSGESYTKEVQGGGIITNYASIVYYASTNKVYKCIDDTMGNDPTNTLYWEEVLNLGDLIANTTITVVVSNTYVRATVDDKMRKIFRKMGRNLGCDEKENKNAYKYDGLLIAADSEVNAGNYDEMEKIIEYLESKLSQQL